MGYSFKKMKAHSPTLKQQNSVIFHPWGGGMCTGYGFLIFCHTVTMVNVYINHEQSFR